MQIFMYITNRQKKRVVVQKTNTIYFPLLIKQLKEIEFKKKKSKRQEQYSSTQENTKQKR